MSLTFLRDLPRHENIALRIFIVLSYRYNFKSDPRNVGAVVILAADESTYTSSTLPLFCVKIELKAGCRSCITHVQPGRAPSDRCAVSSRKYSVRLPAHQRRIVWYQDRGAGAQSVGLAGRSFYTSLGTRTKLGRYGTNWLEVSRLICLQDELFLSHVFGEIAWVLDSGTTEPRTQTPTWVNLPRVALIVLHHRRRFSSPSRLIYSLIVARRDTTTAVLIRITYEDLMIVNGIVIVVNVVLIGVLCTLPRWTKGVRTASESIGRC